MKIFLTQNIFRSSRELIRGLSESESNVNTNTLYCWRSSHVCHMWTRGIYLNNVLSIKTILIDILDFWCQLEDKLKWFDLWKHFWNVACSFHSWKFQRVDYYTAWSNSTKFVEKRDLPNHGQTCGHRFADVIWRIPNPTLIESPCGGTGTWPDYSLNRADKKIEEPFGGKFCTEIDKYSLSEWWGCGSTRTVDSSIKWAQSWNQIQTLKACLFCHNHCAHLRTHMHSTVTASCAVSNR